MSAYIHGGGGEVRIIAVGLSEGNRRKEANQLSRQGARTEVARRAFDFTHPTDVVAAAKVAAGIAHVLRAAATERYRVPPHPILREKTTQPGMRLKIVRQRPPYSAVSVDEAADETVRGTNRRLEQLRSPYALHGPREASEVRVVEEARVSAHVVGLDEADLVSAAQTAAAAHKVGRVSLYGQAFVFEGPDAGVAGQVVASLMTEWTRSDQHPALVVTTHGRDGGLTAVSIGARNHGTLTGAEEIFCRTAEVLTDIKSPFAPDSSLQLPPASVVE